MSKEITFDEFLETTNLVKEIEENFPEDYTSKINNLIEGKDEALAIQMLSHLNTLLLNNDLNKRHLFSVEELNYFHSVRSYSREKAESYRKKEEELYLNRKKGLSKTQKEQYSKVLSNNGRVKINPNRISNKGRKCYFDRTYAVLLQHLTPEETKFLVRIEGKIVSESDTEYKIKTRNFWGLYYGHTKITSPKSSEARNKFVGYEVEDVYWISKKDINFI
jgi:sulfur carrier protein ThiS